MYNACKFKVDPYMLLIVFQKITGAPLLIHPGKHHDSPMEIVKIIRDSGGNVSKTVMSHLDRTIYDYDGLIELAKTGCILEHDFFGIEVSLYQHNPSVDFLSDAQRIHRIKHLIDNGFADQLVIAHDIHTRHRLVSHVCFATFDGNAVFEPHACLLSQMMDVALDVRPRSCCILLSPFCLQICIGFLHL